MNRPVYSLPLPERVQHYRKRAAKALNKACATADQELRAGFLAMASDWQALADGLEKRLSREPLPANDH